jgi:endonuclease/exonuclease/phosphatase family metal-dependent hydrolase
MINVIKLFWNTVLTISALGTVFAVEAKSAESLNVMSFNIRYNNPEDGANAWPHRKHNVSALIKFHQADIVGLQEALYGQLGDLEKDLPQYEWFGVGRDDGKKEGEFTAILYRKDIVSLEKQGTFWCSPTPDTPSKGWDSSLNRTVTWGLFKRNNKESFYVFNTHFDHIGKVARAECALLIRKRIDQIAKKTPVIITGDLNTTPLDQPYKNMTNNKPYLNKMSNASKVSQLKRYGTSSTYTRFDITATNKHPIDYIFVSDSIKVSRFGVLSDSFDGRLPSDHYPLLAEIDF